MVATFLGILMLYNDLQFLNVSLRIHLIFALSGICKERRLVQLLNTPASNLPILDAKVTFLKDLHPENAKYPNFVTLCTVQHSFCVRAGQHRLHVRNALQQLFSSRHRLTSFAENPSIYLWCFLPRIGQHCRCNSSIFTKNALSGQ